MAIAESDKPRFTAEEYYKMIPETNLKVELIDGEIVSECPLDELIKGNAGTLFSGTSATHQDIEGGIYSEFRSFIKKNKGSCRTFFSTYEIELDEYNTVAPDVLIMCDPSKITEKRGYGAPDLVVEVVSSNRSNDYNRKLRLYQKSGVREYWIIDPSEKRTIVYLFGETIHINFYDFDKPVPVGIWEGKLEITIADLLSG